jgi:hypothetical protein
MSIRPKRTVLWIGLNPITSGFRRSVVVHDRVPDGHHIDTLTQPRQPPVSMPSHFILRQDAKRADPCLVGGEPDFVLHQPSQQLTLVALLPRAAQTPLG